MCTVSSILLGVTAWYCGFLLQMAARRIFLQSRPAAVRRISVLSRHMSSLPEDEVLFQRNNRAGVVLLNRPKALNSLNLNMISTMLSTLQSWNTDPDIDIIIAKGAGGKAFCAGGDVVALCKASKTGEELTKEFFYKEYQLDYATSKLKKPYIALLDGISMGGGIGISVHGWFRVATENTLFAMPETAIGFFPDVGGSFFLPRLQGQVGMYLALTGNRLKGRDVKEVGVATHFVRHDKLPALEEELSSTHNLNLDKVQHILDAYHQQSLDVGAKEFSLKDKLETINRCFNGDTVEEIVQALEKDGSEWCTEQLKILGKMSPTSLKVTHHQLREGKHMLLDDCLRMEYRISQRAVVSHDFHEGIRAVLVEKDHKPKWSPAKLEEVLEDTVKSYFAPLPKGEQELDFY